MNIKEACRTLGVNESDDERTIKIAFRRKMRIHHPDSAIQQTKEQQHKAQLINEAYSILKARKHEKLENGRSHGFKENQRQEREEERFQGMVDESVFTERNVYMSYSMHSNLNSQVRTIARGRYLWDPNIEDFALFARSLNHVAMELMEQVERKYGIYDNVDMEVETFSYLKDLFNLLANQFVRPIDCLKKIDDPVKQEKDGRNVYVFHAFLGTKGSSKIFTAMELLQEGDLLFPVAMQDNRLMVMNKDGVELGYLSLEEDELYFVIIPILKRHLAQVKIQVKETYINKKRRPYQSKINVGLYMRINKEAKDIAVGNLNVQIAELLNRYDEALKDKYER